MREGDEGRPCVAITGASGLIGRRLIARLHEDGWEVARVVRRETRADRHEIAWQPGAGTIDAAAFEGIDAVVHLAGEEIAERWTEEKKDRILRSRVEGTSLLARTLASLENPPRVLVSASGVHYYGSRGDEVLTEASTPGDGFLADVVRRWEDATGPASEAGIRVVCMRTAPVIAREGGMIDRVLLPFRLGLGGRLGSGDQYMSWIAADDVVRAYSHVLRHDDLSGPLNAVAPEPVRNREFTEALGRTLDRPTVLPVPALAIRALLGEMGDELLLGSQRVLPERLLASGFTFRYGTLESALTAELVGRETAQQG